MSSNNPSSLAPADAKVDANKQRKLTNAIISDKEKEKEAFEFLEDDDDFEEFENDELDYDNIMNQGGDVDMSGADSSAKGNKNELE